MKNILIFILASICTLGYAQTTHPPQNTGGSPTVVTSGSVTGILPIANGGTNSTTLSGLSLPNATLATPTVTVGAVTYTTSITLQSSDNYKFVDMSPVSSATITVTVPSYSVVAFTNNTQITIDQATAGKVSFVAGTGVTLYSAGNRLTIAVLYGYATLRKRSTGTNEWDVFGNLTP